MHEHTPRELRKLFQDAIVVNIPLDVTADLGVAIKRSRAKRIKALYEHFPSLKPQEKKPDENEKMDDEDEEDDKKRPPIPTVAGMPQREQYGSVVDYLEAKYTRGVMLPDEDVSEEKEGDDRGSVYDSESSFVDDSLLKRDVAEQVLSHSTQTKVGVEEGDFFVNVGTLEVEDHDLMDYDPVVEEEKEKAKRKRQSTDSSKTKAKKPKTTKSDKSVASKKKLAAKKETTKQETKEATPEQKVELESLKQSIAEKEAAWRELYDKLVQDIREMTDEQLPPKKETAKVSLMVPQGKKAGDNMMFSNPHIPGQRLRVKVPNNMNAGGKFVVSVPAPEISDETDNNKFNRDFQDSLDDYSQLYDAWCNATAEYREADPTNTDKYMVNKERLAKFDEMIKVFPQNLVTPIDAMYLRKVVRRARQNKSKRKNRPAPAADSAKAAAAKKAPPPATEKQVPKTVDVNIPGKGRVFATVGLKASEFERDSH